MHTVRQDLRVIALPQTSNLGTCLALTQRPPQADTPTRHRRKCTQLPSRQSGQTDLRPAHSGLRATASPRANLGHQRASDNHLLALGQVPQPGWAAKEAPRGQRWGEGGDWSNSAEASSLQSKDT